MTETPNPNIVDADTLTGQLRPIRRGVLALGSNLGERFANLSGAVATLADTPGVEVTAVSPVYESEPIGAAPGSDKFLNAILTIDTTLTAHDLLDRCLAVEVAFDRERGEPGAPRTLDIDMIVLGDRVADEEELTLPHPRAHERAFVLQPWYDIEADGEIPGQGKVGELLAELDRSTITLCEDLELELP